MASLEFYRQASFLKVSADRPVGIRIPRKRGDVSHFTHGARRRMKDLMAKLENDVVPFMVLSRHNPRQRRTAFSIFVRIAPEIFPVGGPAKRPGSSERS